jgi:hypothetical protein
MFALQGRSKDNRRLDGRRNKGRARNTGKEIKGVPKEMLEGTPVAISEESTLGKIYTYPGKRNKCRSKHKFRDCRIQFTFLNEDNDTPYFPFPMFGRVCRSCGEVERL